MRRFSIFHRLACAVPALAVAFLLLGTFAWAADVPTGFVDRVYRDADGDHKYVVFVPKNYSPKKEWPAILFLHGAGERGKDGRRQTTVGLGPLVKARADVFPFLVVFPQCELTNARLLTSWNADSPNGKRALAILEEVEKEYRVDSKHRILTGWSMGGYGVWNIAAAQPTRWSAIVPVSGGGDESAAAKLKDRPVWAFHGANDTVVRPDESRKMIAAIKAAGGKPRYTEIPQAAHDIWKTVYGSDALYEWMLDPTRNGSASLALRVKPGSRPVISANEDAPFVPAIEIPQAVFLRLGNNVLSELAHTIPHIVPPDLLTGKLADIRDSTVTEGRSFRVQFTQIRYRSKLTRAHIKAYKKDRLNIQMALKDVVLTIGKTYVQGRGRSAVAGPMTVTIGTQRPVWLSVDVTPYVENRRLRLRIVATRFQIEDDNWSITAPASVSTRGLGMTREKVSRGLVNGLRGNRVRFEQEIRGLVPSLILQMEEKLELGEVTRMVNALWPLPVYRPRVRIWPQMVSADENGISIVMGVVAAAIDPTTAPKTPRRMKPAGPPIGELPRHKNLQIGIAPKVLGPLTEMLIDADVARIHVQDIPEKTFARFADPAVLSEIIPDLKRFGDDVKIWSELVLAAPLSVGDVGDRQGVTGTNSHKKSVVQAVSQQAPNDDSDKPAAGSSDDEKEAPKATREIEFSLPKVIVSLAIQADDTTKDWTPYAEFEFNVAQTVSFDVEAPTRQCRILKTSWSGEPQIEVTGRFAPTYKPADKELALDKARSLFLDAWRAWTQRGPVSKIKIADVDFGYSKMRLSDVAWHSQYVMVGFDPPGVVISNASETPLVYETKGPYSQWGGPYTLEAGGFHQFDIAYPLLYRRKVNGGYTTFTLPVGSHSEFRKPVAGGEPRLFLVHEADATSDGKSHKP